MGTEGGLAPEEPYMRAVLARLAFVIGLMLAVALGLEPGTAYAIG